MSVDKSRREFLAAGGIGITAAATPLGALLSSTLQTAAVDDTLTELATTYDPLIGDGEGTRLAREHGVDRRPSWTVQYAEESRESLIEWVNSSETRDLLNEHEPSRSATVIADVDDIGADPIGRWRDRGLSSEDWIEMVDLNIEISMTDPIGSLTSRLENEGLGLSSVERRVLSLSDDVPSASELATDSDAESATPAEIREYVNADTDAVLDVDHSDITIAVVDSGFNSGSGDVLGDRGEDDDISPRLLEESKSVLSDETVDEEGLDVLSDSNGHGSFVASQILSDPDDEVYQGIVPDADLLAVRALDDDGGGSMSQIADAIRYAADQNSDVVCLSLGSPKYGAEIERALQYAVDNDCIPVAATGNDRQATRWIATPASSEYAIGVSATTADDAESARSAYFANIGPHPGTTDLSEGQTTDARPDLAAPGMKINALVGRTNGSITTRELSGTSMAAPIVAGVIGLLVADDSDLAGDIDAVRSRITDHARPIPQAAEVEVGGGMVDAHAAITQTETADQRDDMDGRAQTRGESYQALSNQQGGLILRVLR